MLKNSKKFHNNVKEILSFCDDFVVFKQKLKKYADNSNKPELLTAFDYKE